jgi:hypothetical protein
MTTLVIANSFEANVSRTGCGQTHINTLVLSVIRIRLFDPFEHPMPSSPFRLTLGERTIEGKCDEDAWIEIRVIDVPEKATIEWGVVDDGEEEIPQGPGYPEATTDSSSDQATAPPPDAKTADPNPAPPDQKQAINYLYEREIHLVFDTAEEQATLQRLHNLGYNVWETLEENVRAFQLTYQRSLTGNISDIKSDLWGWHDDCSPNPFPQLETKDNVK